MRFTLPVVLAAALSSLLVGVDGASQDTKKPEKKKKELPPWPTPQLPNGKSIVTDVSNEFIKPTTGNLRDGVTIAKTPPKIDFLYYPGQTYRAAIWSNWGDGLAANGKYYSSIGDHNAPEGNAFVYEYDPATQILRMLVNIRDILQLAMGWYTPGKVHSRLDMGKDGKVYFSTHRGSTTTTTAKNNYSGDWIMRVDPKTSKTEIVAHGPVKNHCLPCSRLDPDRLIFYGGTAPGTKADGGVKLVAYDVENKKVIYEGDNGPSRYMIFARSTGKIYWTPGVENGIGDLVCFDPAKPAGPYPINAKISLRTASEETPLGMVYTIGTHSKEVGPVIYSFNTKTEKVEEIGPAAVASMTYITSVKVDPNGRYLYYIPGAHSGAERDGTPVVQYDLKTKTRKVLAFLHPYYKTKYDAIPVGTYSLDIDAKGDKLYTTWNVDRGIARHWDCCALTVIHIPDSERQP